jgi:hypothetical protein
MEPDDWKRPRPHVMWKLADLIEKHADELTELESLNNGKPRPMRSGEWSSVVPHTFLELLGRDRATFPGLRAIPLVAPEAQQAVGLVVSERDPLSPLVRALVEVAQQFDLTGQLAPSVPSPSPDRIFR